MKTSRMSAPNAAAIYLCLKSFPLTHQLQYTVWVVSALNSFLDAQNLRSSVCFIIVIMIITINIITCIIQGSSESDESLCMLFAIRI